MGPVSDSPALVPASTARDRPGLAEALLDAAIQARRAGTLPELLRQHPLAARWCQRRWADLLADAGDGSDAARADLLLRALTAQLRPDGGAGFEAVDAEAWLQRPGWRPFLAMAAHLGLVAVPDFPRQYRRRAGEPVLDNLCGLWDVGPSTLYRLLEKARVAMAHALLQGPVDGARRLAVRRLALPPHGHAEAAARAALRGDAGAELWHRWQAGDLTGANTLLRQRAEALAGLPETDEMLAGLRTLPAPPRARFDLLMAGAAIERARSNADGERRACEAALQLAQAHDDRLLLGIAYSALGKFHEPRDGDRAFACYQHSAEALRGLDPEHGDVQALEHFVTTHVRLAWLYLQRNDERSRAVLDRAEALRTGFAVPDPLLGMLEQVWGLYWRFAGDLGRSIEHRQRALNVFERLGDRRSALAACQNIASALAERREFARAIQYAERVLDAARSETVDAELVGSAHGTLGSVYFWMGDFTRAIAQYQEALRHIEAFGLHRLGFRTRFNLAEAHFARFRELRDPEDERRGDAYVDELQRADASQSSPQVLEAVQRLKASTLDAGAADAPRGLVDAERAAHFAEMQTIAAQRRVLAVPGDAAAHAEAHLAIAHAYAAIAAKEREAARTIVEREGLHARFAGEFAGLRQTFERELSLEDRVAAQWKQAAPELLDDTRRAAVVAHLVREGSLGKSVYAELAAVSPATASKHLAVLTERGLVEQKGKGPSTRYERPA